MVFFSAIFFFCLLMVAYVYVGYPVLALILSTINNRQVRKTRHWPTVSILIAAHNEENHIGTTIENKLALEYPRDKIEIIVISDGSTDETDNIVSRYEQQGIRLLRQEPRAGKTSALNMAVRSARGEIIVFSDANSLYRENAIQKLVQNFSDDGVGYVTGKMVYTKPDGSTVGDGCTAYMKYENFLRGVETRVGSIVGVDGGIDAVRKSLYRPMRQDQLPDFVLPLAVVKQGFRVVYEPGAVLHEATLVSQEDEYAMRVRVTLRALWALKDMKHMLNPCRYTTFAWQMWSHKVLRYLCIVFLAGLYFANAVLWLEGLGYRIFFLLQSCLYCLAFS
ncbi:MAG TPA: glycosyltransferase family 2 protein, partial [Syntrophorhabdus aromaticivorans]|nr:glycosyltransferase family 2 protein [Syntrophorhabdus aromaticivorans]